MKERNVLYGELHEGCINNVSDWGSLETHARG